MYLFEFEDLTLVRVMIAQGQNDPNSPHIRDALHMLERLMQAAEAGGRLGSMIEIYILQARALQAHGEPGQALVALGHALTLAAPEGYVRVFVDEGAPIAELLGAVQTRNSAADYIEKLLAAFPDQDKESRRQAGKEPEQSDNRTGSLSPSLPASLSLLEPLTARELEVLRLIADGASNRAIAEQLVITVGTVKRHINNLFSKLGVQSRTQAIRAARAMRLLGP